LDGRSPDEDRAFQGIDRLSLGVASQGGQEPVLREDLFLSYVQQQETTRSIGVLKGPWLVTVLAKKGGLLVARDAGNGNTRSQITLGRGHAEGAGGSWAFGKRDAGTERMRNSWNPFLGENIEEKGPEALE